jgi:hypothetical protein
MILGRLEGPKKVVAIGRAIVYVHPYTIQLPPDEDVL